MRCLEPAGGDVISKNLTEKAMDEPPEKRRRKMTREDDARCMVMLVAPFIPLMWPGATGRVTPEGCFVAGSAVGCGLVFAVKLALSPVSPFCRAVASLLAVLNGLLLSGIMADMAG